MTSIPASRRARAMTLAPRSCPSRPGLATSTRILRVSDIWLLILAEQRNSNQHSAVSIQPCKCTEAIKNSGDVYEALAARALAFRFPPRLRVSVVDSPFDSSRLRHRYHAAKLQYGCHVLAICSTCFGVGGLRLR